MSLQQMLPPLTYTVNYLREINSYYGSELTHTAHRSTTFEQLTSRFCIVQNHFQTEMFSFFLPPFLRRSTSILAKDFVGIRESLAVHNYIHMYIFIYFRSQLSTEKT